MPDDFIPQVNTLKPVHEKDPTPLEDRFQHLMSALDKRGTELRGDKSSFPSISMDQFQDRLRSLRQGTVKWGAARIESFFVKEIIREYPDLKINDRAIESSADFCDWIKKGPWNNQMRGIVAYASGALWGSSNQWAINMEDEFCKLLCIKFTGLKSNNKKLLRLHKGRCVAAILVKGKGSLVGKFRNTCKRKYLEAVYCRTEKPKLGGATETGEGKVAVPRMIYQEDARLETHGFCGKLAKCEGHPHLESAPAQVVTGTNTPSPSSRSAASVDTLSSLEDTPQGGLADCLQAYGVKSVDEFKSFLESLSPELKDRMKSQEVDTPSTSLGSTSNESRFEPHDSSPPSAVNKAGDVPVPVS